MEKITKFAMVFHNHQPVGNFEHVIEKAVKTSYMPFIEVLKLFPSIRVTLHFSGPLLNYLVKNNQKLIEEIGRLLGDGRVEIMSSGYGEPILTAIPERDRVPQILRMNKLIEEVFDYIPVGLWVTERVFDPILVKSYVEAGMEYILLDDCHFAKIGIDSNSSDGPYLMVTDGGSINIFKSDSNLRSGMPFESVESIVGWLSRYRLEKEGVIVVGDDGEKFGEWPGMFEHVYGRGRWLEKFFLELENLSDNIQTTTLREIRREPERQVYLPAGSYHEMNRWAGSDCRLSLMGKVGKFEEKQLQAANWFNFFHKYKEAATIYGKMSKLSEELALIPDQHFLWKGREELFNAQCNCAYWHGVFGGIYLPHLRMKLVEHLISTRKLIRYYFGEFLREIKKEELEYSSKKHLDWIRAGIYRKEYEKHDLMDLIYQTSNDEVVNGYVVSKPPSMIEYDFDFDGVDEYLLRGENIETIVDPNEGGTIISLESMDKNFDFALVMTRRKEEYHNDYSGTVENMEKTPPFVYDPFRRASFREHFIDNPTLESFQNLNYEEMGDFVNGCFDVIDKGNSFLELYRRGKVFVENSMKEIGITKKLSIDGRKLLVDYMVDDIKSGGLPQFISELNFMFMSHEGDRYIEYDGRRFSLKNEMIFEGKNEIIFRDNYLELGVKVRVDCNKLYYIPVFTISRNFDKFEAIFQGFSLYIVLDGGGEKRVEVEFLD